MYYTAYGLQIASELPLPELLPSPATHPEVHIRYGSVPTGLDNPVMQGVVFQAQPDQLLLRLEGIANYLISDGDTITIYSLNGFDWGRTEIEINGGLFRGGFTHTIARLKSGAQYTANLYQFADPSGLRFDPDERRVNSVSLVAETKHGSLVWAGTFDVPQ